MSALDITIPHQLPQQEAVARIQKLLDKLKKEQGKYIKDVKEEWNGNTGNFQFTAQGFNISGIIKVTDSNVTINGQLPFAVSLFKGQISKVITDKATELLT